MTKILGIDVESQQWNNKRDELEQKLVSAAIDLANHTMSNSFTIPVRQNGYQIVFQPTPRENSNAKATD